MTPLNIGEAARNERAYGLLVRTATSSCCACGRQPGASSLRTRRRAARLRTSWSSPTSSGAIGSDARRSPTKVMRVNGRDLRVDRRHATRGFRARCWACSSTSGCRRSRRPRCWRARRSSTHGTVRGYYVMGRLATRAQVTQAAAAVAGEMRGSPGALPGGQPRVAVEVLPFWRASRGPQGFLVQALTLLQGVLLLLLLAVCGNTTNLLLARASQRQREVGVRLAVGGGPGAWHGCSCSRPRYGPRRGGASARCSRRGAHG